MVRNSAYVMTGAVVALVSLGLVMLTSVSAFVPANQGDPAFFISRQAVWLLLGLIGGVIGARVPYQFWLRHAWWLLGAGAVLMLACLLPGIGLEINGARRWLDLGPMRMQPIEPFKLAVVMALVAWMAGGRDRPESFKEGFAIPLLILAGAAVPCLLQKDLGSTLLLALIVLMIMFVSGVSWKFILPLPVAAVTGILTLAMMMPQRRTRILAFLNPEEHATGAGWQLMNALLAFGSGGVTGRGLGNSIQKMKWLPESHTDFIFPIIGEELGLVVSLAVVLAFLMICLAGGITACNAPDGAGILLGLGLVSLITLQAGMNIAVVTGLIPTKGIGLPFISYGGSNLLMCFCAVGIMLNIHHQGLSRVQPRPRTVLPPVLTEAL